MTSYPDSPESVAFCLFEIIVLRQRREKESDDFVRWALDLYAECLATVKGERASRHRRLH